MVRIHLNQPKKVNPNLKCVLHQSLHLKVEKNLSFVKFNQIRVIEGVRDVPIIR